MNKIALLAIITLVFVVGCVSECSSDADCPVPTIRCPPGTTPVNPVCVQGSCTQLECIGDAIPDNPMGFDDSTNDSVIDLNESTDLNESDDNFTDEPLWEGECNSSSQCAEWQDCIHSECVAQPGRCTSDTDCDSWMNCTDHVCVLIEGKCENQTHCEADELCIEHVCKKQPFQYIVTRVSCNANEMIVLFKNSDFRTLNQTLYTIGDNGENVTADKRVEVAPGEEMTLKFSSKKYSVFTTGNEYRIVLELVNKREAPKVIC